MGLGRGRLEGWQRGGESSRGGGRGGLVGGGIGPLSLITGAKKLLQDVSGVNFNGGSRMMLNSLQDVLYLMIVQRPTEDQMAEAMERMNASGQARR